MGLCDICVSQFLHNPASNLTKLKVAADREHWKLVFIKFLCKLLYSNIFNSVYEHFCTEVMPTWYYFFQLNQVICELTFWAEKSHLSLKFSGYSPKLTVRLRKSPFDLSYGQIFQNSFLDFIKCYYKIFSFSSQQKVSFPVAEKIKAFQSWSTRDSSKFVTWAPIFSWIFRESWQKICFHFISFISKCWISFIIICHIMCTMGVTAIRQFTDTVFESLYTLFFSCF